MPLDLGIKLGQEGVKIVGVPGLRGTPNGLHVLLRHRRLSISRRGRVCRGGRGLWRPPRLTSGSDNIAIGHNALVSNTTGSGNVATGTYALPSNSTGNNNVATGDSALSFNTTGSNNIAIGHAALYANTTGNDNIAAGIDALHESVSGSRNLATGRGALYGNALGDDNVASGYQALVLNFTGSNNVATGNNALFANTGGNNNLAAGLGALRANTTGSSNIALGANAGRKLTTGSNNVAIANDGVAGESGAIRIGSAAKQTAAFIAGINGTTLGGAAKPVVVNSSGRLGVAPAPSASLANTIEQLAAQVERQRSENARQQREIDRLRGQLKGG